ncbi:MAG: metallophosphoesterase family protein [Haloechinothrix sp.]
MESAPRPRPTDLSEQQLGFTPQPAVRWLAPTVLVGTGIKALLASIFGAYADKRELQGSLPATLHRFADDDGIWLDYVADVGDGFNATYSIATLLAREQIEPAGHDPLPRGKLLVMGGDQVYPSASTRAYEDRTKGVYEAAMPVAQDDPPTLFALPGNHDWYDGLTAFLRVFAQRRPFGGWRTEQTRSYFAVELPQRWWLFGIDTQFDDHIDAPQLEYFRTAAAELRPGDAIILCVPTPAWVDAGSGGDHESYDIIAFFDREIVRPAGATIRLMLSGDKHHYSRYTERDGTRQSITTGLGGAYLTATHRLPEKLGLPPAASRVRPGNPPATYDLAARYPSKARSELFAAGIIRLPWHNPGFWGLSGITQSVVALAVMYGLAGTVGPGPQGFFTLVASWTPAVIVALIVVLSGLGFARLDPRTPLRAAHTAGALHATAHLALSVGWAYAIIWLYRDVLPDSVFSDWATLILILAGTPVMIGFLHAELVAVYLMIASRFGINLNELMAGQSVQDHKGFLRLHIDPSGTLTCYPIKLPKVCHAWKPDPDGAPSDPWLRPAGAELRPELIEAPIVVPHAT